MTVANQLLGTEVNITTAAVCDPRKNAGSFVLRCVINPNMVLPYLVSLFSFRPPIFASL